MNKKLLLIIILEIVICIFCINISYAGSFDFAYPEMEGNYEPVVVPSPPPGDGGGGYIPTPTPPVITEPEEPKANISVPTKVQGIVFEDLEKIESENDGSMDGTKHLTNNYTYDANEPKVQGVKVSFGASSQLTDSNGTYSFSMPGSYDINFTYGKEIKEDNYGLNQNTFKYNGQDYNMVVMGNGMAHYDKSYLRKIKEIDKSFTEVYIVIDHSTSMRAFLEGEKSRIEIVKESAINFVNEIFAKAEGNLAVGYIAFGYESVILKKPTDIKEDVIDAIENFKVVAGVGAYSGKIAENFSSLNHKVGSNIGGAVKKAKNNYLAGNSNKVMIVFSDGAATAHNDVESLYASDSDPIIEYKLNQVAQKTKIDLKAVIESEITLINILNKTEGTEKEFVEKSFKDGEAWIGNYYEVNYLNLEAVTDTLLNDTISIIENTESEALNYTDEKTFNGDDDAERRKEVNAYYNEFYYDKLKMFEVIDKLNGTEENDINVVSNQTKYDNNYSNSKKKRLYKKFIKDGIEDENSDVGKFINNSWMKTTSTNIELYGFVYDASGKVSQITTGSSIAYEFSYYTDGEGIEHCVIVDNRGTGLSGDYKASNVTVNQTTITLNAALIKRDEFKLSLDKLITGVKLTLSDGTVLYNMISNNASQTVSKNKEFKEAYCKQLQMKSGLIDKVDMNVQKLDIEEVNNIPEAVCLTVDSDLMQGAIIEVEYTLVIKNNSKNATFSKGFAIVDYFDNDLVYRPENTLLTEEGKNSDYNWEALKTKELKNKKMISDNAMKYGDKQCLYINFDKEGYEKLENIPNDGNITNFETNSKYINPVIGNNGERYVKVVLSRVLSAEIVEEFCYRNQAEIIKYKNNNSRRMNYIEVNGMLSTYKYPISGNYVPTGFLEVLPDSFTNINEIDTAVSNKVSLIPPTGKVAKKYDNRIICLVAVILVITTSYFTIRKGIKKNKILS